MRPPDWGWSCYVSVGAALALTVLFAIANWIVQPMVVQQKQQRHQEMQDRWGIAWEDVGPMRCYWRVEDPESRVCVPPAER